MFPVILNHTAQKLLAVDERLSALEQENSKLLAAVKGFDMLGYIPPLIKQMNWGRYYLY